MQARPSPVHATTPAQPQDAGAGTKAIAPARDRLQSRALTASVTLALAVGLAHLEHALWRPNRLSPWPLLLSLCFALVVWRLRAATAAASALGGLICLLLATRATPALTENEPLPHGLSPALLPLVVLFLLTFAATRYKRRLKEAGGLAEPRSGRRASQIAANLGAAGLCAAAGFYPGALAALAEATADTLSSEIGQALGGPTWLLTTLRSVPPGTDGGISLPGTAAGLLGAGLVILAGIPGLESPRQAVVLFAAGAAGLLFDSLLGATLERRGLLGNDLVNGSSTLFSALLAGWLLR